MCDSDRERYGGPEWVEVSFAQIIDEEAGLIERLEQGWNMSLSEFMVGNSRAMTRPVQAMIWLARHKAGCVDDVRTFRPKVQDTSGVRYEFLPEELAAADADPPANRAGRRAAKQATGRKSRAGSKASSTNTGSTSSDT